MTPMDTPEKVARFLAGMAYPRDEIERTVAKDFPGADAAAVVDEAFRQVGRWDEELDREVRREQDAAIAAEHEEK